MRRRESKPFRGVRPINEIVPILYGERDFDAFGDFDELVESVSYSVSKTCQVRGSNPCRGATSGLRHTDCTLTRALRARFTFSRMSEAEAVQMKGLGRWL